MRNIIIVLLAIFGIYFYATFDRVKAYTNSYQPILVTGDCLTHYGVVSLEILVPPFEDFTYDARQELHRQYLADACEAKEGTL